MVNPLYITNMNKYRKIKHLCKKWIKALCKTRHQKQQRCARMYDRRRDSSGRNIDSPFHEIGGYENLLKNTSWLLHIVMEKKSLRPQRTKFSLLAWRKWHSLNKWSANGMTSSGVGWRCLYGEGQSASSRSFPPRGPSSTSISSSHRGHLVRRLASSRVRNRKR